MVATRTADSPHGSGSCVAPKRAAEHRSTGTEDRRQSQGGGGASYARRPPGTEVSSTMGAAGHPFGAQAAALLRGRPAAARHAVSGGCGRRGRGRSSPRLPPLSVAGGEGARGPEEERGGGEGGPLGVAAAPQEGRGCRSWRQWTMRASALLGFFFGSEEEKREEEADEANGVRGLASPLTILGGISCWCVTSFCGRAFRGQRHWYLLGWFYW